MQKQLERYLAWCTKKTILRDKPNIIAIGGSVGKTSTRHIFTIALKGCERSNEIRTSTKNYNNELGVPLSVFACSMPGRNPSKWLKLLWEATAHALGIKHLTVKHIFLEMAADHPGDIGYLTDMAPPQIVIITAMGAEHTEFFGSTEQAIQEERQLLKALSGRQGEAILNMDDVPTWESKRLTDAESIGFGKNPDAVVRIVNTSVRINEPEPENNGLQIDLEILKHDVRKIFLKGVYGEPWAYAVAALMAYLVSLDHEVGRVLTYLQENFIPMPGRSCLIPGIKKTYLLDDSYNSQPQAMVAAIKGLANFPVPEGGRKIAVLGDMLELGDQSLAEHQAIGKLVAASAIDILVCCGKLSPAIAESALEAGMSGDKIKLFETSSEAGLYLQNQVIRPGDAILIKGSQSARMERVTKELMADPLKAPELLVRQSPDWLSK